MSELPANWSMTRIGEVADINPRSMKNELDDDTLASFVPMKCVEAETGRFALPENKKVGEVKIGYTPMRDGDVIFAKVTPCMENGKGAVVRGLTNGIGFGSTEFYALRPKDNLMSEFLFYYIIQQGFRREAERHMTGAVGLRRVPRAFIEEHDIPLPPRSEQRRIVARIEELFSRLDAGVAALRHAKAQLQRYRQSVLAAAVTGQLTQAWREQHPDTETAEGLLQRILTERRKSWNGRGNYSEPASPKPLAFDLPSSSWTRVSIDQLAVDTTIGLVRAAVLQNSNGEGFAYLKMDKIDMNGGVNLDGLVYVDATEEEVERFSLRKGDVLFNTRNSVELVGKTGHVASEPVTPLVFNNNLMRIRFVDSALPAFVALQMCSKQFRDRMEGAKRATTSIAAVYGKDLRPLPIALPPLAEQHQIVAEVEARTTAIDHLEAELDRQITRSNRLRQSTLKAAFEGNLDYPSRTSIV